MPYTHSSRRGFTLIELLVVIGIITILMGLIIPSLSRSRQQARNVACKQVLHGLSIAMRVYLDENNRVLPRSAQMPSVNAGYEPLPVSLASQVQSPKAWLCPADKRGYQRSDGKNFDSYFDGETLSYEYNMSIGGQRIESGVYFAYLGEPGTMILGDFDSFHGPSGSSDAKYILYGDGHVGPVDDIIKQYAAGQ